MPIQEAMGSGLPVLVPMGTGLISGYAQLMTSDNSYAIAIEDQWSDASIQKEFERGQLWHQPVLSSVRQVMRYVVEHPEEAAAKGKVAQREMQEQYSIKVIAEQVLLPQFVRIRKLLSERSAKQ